MKKFQEIERKFLVKNDSFKRMAMHSDTICQGFLSVDPDRVVRVRIKGGEGFITIKSRPQKDHFAHFEYEIPIPAADAEKLLSLCLPYPIEKERFYVPIEGQELCFEVDVFHDRLEGLIVAEIELQDENQCFPHPDFLGEEVTDNTQYSNSQLSKIESFAELNKKK
mgnify:CR=1 FL=1